MSTLAPRMKGSFPRRHNGRQMSRTPCRQQSTHKSRLCTGQVLWNTNNLINIRKLISLAANRIPSMGVARIFQRGPHTESYRGYSPDFHLNIVGCLLTKRLTK